MAAMTDAPAVSVTRFTRAFAMPSAETFGIKPIGDFVRAYLACSKASVDPFARNQRFATLTNDIDLATSAHCHEDAEQFLSKLPPASFDLALFDPPYSPRQVSEHYRSIGREVTKADTQTSALYSRVRKALCPVVRPGGVVLSFGWHSNGMGAAYDMLEVMLVAHGSAHNDTICIAERKRP